MEKRLASGATLSCAEVGHQKLQSRCLKQTDAGGILQSVPAGRLLLLTVRKLLILQCVRSAECAAYRVRVSLDCHSRVLVRSLRARLCPASRFAHPAVALSVRFINVVARPFP